MVSTPNLWVTRVARVVRVTRVVVVVRAVLVVRVVRVVWVVWVIRVVRARYERGVSQRIPRVASYSLMKSVLTQKLRRWPLKLDGRKIAHFRVTGYRVYNPG